MNFTNWHCKLNRRIRLIKKMFGFGPKLKTYVGPVDPEDKGKREFLEWHLTLVEGPGVIGSIDYIGNNVWRFNSAFGNVKEFVILKDREERHKPHIQYGKVNDQWVKLKHEGYYLIENSEGKDERS
jgi:hypothetical protein